jgi:hypothetical protein
MATAVLHLSQSITTGQTNQQSDQGEPHVARVPGGLPVLARLKGARIQTSQHQNDQSGDNDWQVMIVMSHFSIAFCKLRFHSIIFFRRFNFFIYRLVEGSTREVKTSLDFELERF